MKISSMETGKILIFSICEFGEMYAVTRMYKPDAAQLVDIFALNAFIGIFFAFDCLHVAFTWFHLVFILFPIMGDVSPCSCACGLALRP